MSLFSEATHDWCEAPVVDTFTIARGPVAVNIDEAFLRRVCDNMNARITSRGSYSPLVVGHTADNGGTTEASSTQVVGTLSDWRAGMWTGDGSHAPYFAAIAKHWIPKKQKVVIDGVPLELTSHELIQKFPRRSGEVWTSKAEIDPHCLLGATCPERDLGHLRLASNGDTAVSYNSPGELKVADKKDDAKGEVTGGEHDTAGSKALEGIVNALAALLEQFKEIGGKIESLVAGGGEGKEGAEGGSNEEYEQMLKQLMAEHGGDSGAQGAGAGAAQAQPAPDEKATKLARDLAVAQEQLAEIQLTNRVREFVTAEGLDPALLNDKVLIKDLLAVPVDMQTRQLERLRLGRTLPGGNQAEVGAAINSGGGTANVYTAADMPKITGHAASKNISFTAAAKELGFTSPRS